MTKTFMGAALAALLLCAGSQAAPPPRDEALDRAAIHNLLMAYGSTLDTRDFDGFSQLFARDGVYVAGSGEKASGAQAGEMMRKVFATNASGARSPNYHVFFNEVITFDGPDKAHATSMSFWVVPDENRRPVPLMMGGYDDEIVRENGQWKFQSRTVKSMFPAQASAAGATK